MFNSLWDKHGPTSRLADALRRGAARCRTAGLNLLFPPRCACCDAGLPQEQNDLLLCITCERLLAAEIGACCRRCGAPGVDPDDSSDGCQSCRQTPLRFDTVIPLGIYQDGLREVVLRMKRARGDALSAAMGRLLARRRREQLAALKADLILPVPMFWARRLKRGANSPEILARCLGGTLGVKVRRRVLVRCRNTLPQANLPPKQRFRNVRGAFRVRTGGHLQGARVLLVDDILTTGATCSEAAGVLKGAGVTMVAAAVIARARQPNST